MVEGNWKKSSLIIELVLLGLCALWMGLCFWAAGPQRDPTINPIPLMSWQYASFLGYLPAMWLVYRLKDNSARPLLLILIVVFAVGLRLVTFIRTPNLSSDVYRYVWDGRLPNVGVNPYLYVPADEHLTAYRNRIWEQVSCKRFEAVYPPFTSATFAGLYRIAPDNPDAFRLFFTLMDLGCIGLLVLLLRQLKKPASLVALYALHPLAITEFAASSHLDSLAIFFMLAAMFYWLKDRPQACGIWLGLAVMTKAFPVLILPFLMKRGGKKLLLPFMVVCLLCTLPFMGAGKAFFSGMIHYASGWESNPSLFSIVKSLTSQLPHAFIWPRLIMLGLYLAFYIWLFRSAGNSHQRIGLSLTYAYGCYYLFSGTIFPWYLTIILPLLCLFFSPGLWLWTITVGLHHVRMFTNPEHLIIWVFIQYLPVYTILVPELYLYAKQRALHRILQGRLEPAADLSSS